MAQASSWRVKACQVIEQVIKDAPPGADLVKLIDEAYPFGDRKYLPYKMWLEERKKVLLRLNLYQVPKNRKCPYHPNGQTCLICMNK
jgi:hypothetical protein